MNMMQLFLANDWIMPAIILALVAAWLFVAASLSLYQTTKRSYYALWNLAIVLYGLSLAASIWLNVFPSSGPAFILRSSLVGATAVVLFWSCFHIGLRPRHWREMACAVAFVVLWNFTTLRLHVFEPRSLSLWTAFAMYSLLAAAAICTGLAYYNERKSNRSAVAVGIGLTLWGGMTLTMAFASQSKTIAVFSYICSAVFMMIAALGLILQHEVRSSEEKYRALFDATKDAIFIIDLWTYEIIDANKAAVTLTGSEPVALLGSSFLKWCPELAKRGTQREEQRKMLDALFQPYGEFTIVRPFGGNVRCEGELKPVRIGNRSALQLSIREVPKREPARSPIDRGENASPLAQLVASVAHELNNPLAAAMGRAHHLSKDTTLPSKAHAEVQQIFNETERAAKILTNVLNFIRPSGPQFVTTDLNRTVNAVLENRKNDLEAAHVILETRLQDGVKRTKADTSQLSNALSSLVTNAIQAMEAQTTERKLTVTTEESGHYVRIGVKDTGPGIRAEVQEKIFEPFFTTRPAGKGTGLGFTVARTVVEDHRGKIWVETQPGQGATFYIEIPIVPCEDEAASPAAEKETGATNKSAQRQLLLVDDEPGILDALSALLVDAGYAVETAQNGKDAINRIATKNYDLIMSDLYMPQMDGRQLYTSVREQNPALAKRIVFLTGDSISSSTRAFLEETGNRWLCKPFGMQEVEAVVRDVTMQGPITVRTSAVAQNN